jgi:hypothetical protein
MSIPFLCAGLSGADVGNCRCSVKCIIAAQAAGAFKCNTAKPLLHNVSATVRVQVGSGLALIAGTAYRNDRWRRRTVECSCSSK